MQLKEYPVDHRIGDVEPGFTEFCSGSREELMKIERRSMRSIGNFNFERFQATS